MKKSILVLIFLIGIYLLLPARQKTEQTTTDTLFSLITKLPDDTSKVNALNGLANKCLDFDPDKSMKYSRMALDLSRRLDFKKGIASSCYMTGVVYCIHSNIPEAIKIVTEAQKIFEMLHDKTGIGNCIHAIGKINLQQDNLPEALKYFFTAMKLFKSTGDKNNIASCYQDIGTVYNVLGNYAEASKNFEASLKIDEETGNKDQQTISLLCISNIYNLQGNTDEALKNALEALKTAQGSNNKTDLADCFKTLGFIYTARKNYTEALDKLFAAEKIFLQSGNKMPLADVYGAIGAVYANQSEFGKAEKYYNNALQIAHEIGSISVIEAANLMLSDTYEMTGDYNKSLETYKAYIVAKDSIFNEENTKKAIKAQLQYDFEKKETSDRAEHSKKIQQKNIIIYGAFAAFAALLTISALLIYQSKLKAKHQKAELEQKQLRAQMNPHFIFNCLNAIQHFVMTNDFKNVNKYLTGFALLMRQTLENSKSNTIIIRKELDYLNNYLSLEWMLFEDKFSYEISCNENIDIDSEEIPSMIIQPFIENAIRHGLCFLTNRPGLLSVNFYRKEGYLFCEVADNGIGREESQKLKMATELLHESQGMELTRQRLELVSKTNGSDYEIEVTDKKNATDQPEGTTVTIKFPANL